MPQQQRDLSHLPMEDTQGRLLGQEETLEQAMASHSSILVWRIPWTPEPGRLQSMGSQELDMTWWLNNNKSYSWELHLHDLIISQRHNHKEGGMGLGLQHMNLGGGDTKLQSIHSSPSPLPQFMSLSHVKYISTVLKVLTHSNNNIKLLSSDLI